MPMKQGGKFLKRLKGKQALDGIYGSLNRLALFIINWHLLEDIGFQRVFLMVWI